MSVAIAEEREIDRSPEFDQAALHNHSNLGDALACDSCKPAEPLAFVPPSQGARIDKLTRLVAQQEGDLNEACRKIAVQGMTIRNVRRDLLDLYHKARHGVEITAHDIANIIPDSPVEFKKAA